MSNRIRTWRRAAIATVGTVAAAAALAPVMDVAAVPPPAPVAAPSGDECGDAVPKADGGTWSCTFVDEFGGRRLDRDTWLAAETSWSGFTIGSTCLTDSRKNIRVRRGKLHLTARDEGKEFTCKNPSGDFTTRYTGAHLTTRDSFTQTYGRFEVRAKYPDTEVQGLHGGFWMYPEEGVYGDWPNSGEIDVAEWWSIDNELVMPSLHYPGETWWYDSGWWCRTADVSKFHTYTVEWNAEEMRFYQDGDLCFSRSWEPDEPLVAPQPFDQPFSMLLTMGVGPKSGHNYVTEDTELPASYVVDYVKAWR